jgi:hypothetical protein
MPENLRETIAKDEAILADPKASTKKKRFACIDMCFSRRLIKKGVEVLED